MKRTLMTLAALALVVAAAAAVLVLWPSPIDPVGWEPAPGRALDGALAANTALRQAERLAEGRVQGPEDVAVDAAGRLYVGTADGRVLRLGPRGEPVETFATTGGRPLGLHFHDGDLYVADAYEGLLRIAPDGTIATLATGAAGVPFAFTDDLDVASDGRVYFSDASSRWHQEQYLYDLLEGRPHGRLLVWDPATGESEVLLRDLYFANGVALSQDEDFVLVNETYRYRIRRYWLRGPRAGRDEVFLDRLPGFADGVSANRRGTFWVAFFTVRNPRAELLHRRPAVARLVAKLPRVFWPRPEPYGLVVALGEDGPVLRSLHDPGGITIPQVTSVEEVAGALYLGNLDGDFVGRLPLADLR